MLTENIKAPTELYFLLFEQTNRSWQRKLSVFYFIVGTVLWLIYGKDMAESSVEVLCLILGQ